METGDFKNLWHNTEKKKIFKHFSNKNLLQPESEQAGR